MNGANRFEKRKVEFPKSTPVSYKIRDPAPIARPSKKLAYIAAFFYLSNISILAYGFYQYEKYHNKDESAHASQTVAEIAQPQLGLLSKVNEAAQENQRLTSDNIAMDQELQRAQERIAVLNEALSNARTNALEQTSSAAQNDLAERLQALEIENEVLMRERDAARSSIDELEQAAAKAGLPQAEEAVQQIDGQLGDLQARLKQRERELALVEERLDQKQTEISALNTENERLISSLDAELSKSEQKLKEIANLKKSGESLEELKAEQANWVSQRAALNTVIRNLGQEKSDLEVELDGLKRQISQRETDAESGEALLAELAVLKKDHELLQERYTLLRSSNDALKENVSSTAAGLTFHEKQEGVTEGAETTAEALKVEINKLQDSLNAVEQDKSTLEQENLRFQEQIVSLLEQLESQGDQSPANQVATESDDTPLDHLKDQLLNSEKEKEQLEDLLVQLAPFPPPPAPRAQQ